MSSNSRASTGLSICALFSPTLGRYPLAPHRGRQSFCRSGTLAVPFGPFIFGYLCLFWICPLHQRSIFCRTPLPKVLQQLSTFFFFNYVLNVFFYSSFFIQVWTWTMPSVRPQAHSTGEKAGLSLANLSSKVFLRAVKLYMWPVILIITLMGFSLWVLSNLVDGAQRDSKHLSLTSIL